MHRVLRHGITALAFLGMTAGIAAAAPLNPVTISDQAGVEVRGDFQVGPTRFVLEMDPGEERIIEIQLTSREGEPRTYTLGIEDFSVTDDGTDSIQFYGNGAGPFSAKSWIDPAAWNIGINHGQRAFVPVKVTVPKNAAVGDHYSVVLFQRDPKANQGGGFNLVARIGALLLITVKGDLVREGSMQGFSVGKQLNWSLPVQFALRYRNTGTVHLVPTGHIEISNLLGIPVDDIPVKDWYVLRNSLRQRDIAWQPKFALGYYTATLHLSSAGQQGETVQTVSFWVIPALPVLIVLLAIFAVSFLVQAFFSRFEIKKKREKKA